MESIHRECGPDDALAVANALQVSYARHGAASAPFPETATDEAETPYYASTRLDLELAMQRERFRSNASKLVRAIEALGELNATIMRNDAPAIQKGFEAFREEFGLSLTTALKAISLRNSCCPSGKLVLDDRAVLEPYQRPIRQVVIGAFEGTSDDNNDYMRSRRSFVNFVERNRLNHADAAIVTDMLTPLKTSRFDLAHRLQAFGRRGLIDTVAYLFRAKRMLLLDGKVEDARLIDETLPGEVRDAWSRTFVSIDVEALQRLVGEPDQFFDVTLFAHLPAWSEYPDLHDYRLAIENGMGARLDGRHNLSQKRASSVVEPKKTAEELLDAPLLVGVPAIAKIPSGGFHRTIALVASVEEGMLKTPDGDALYQLLDHTVNVAYLLTVDEIEGLLPQRKDDLTYEYLRTALLNDCESTSKRNHAVRRALQELLRRDFDGDIVKFMDAVDSADGHVAQHFFNLCAEPFLTSLYALYPDADGVMEAQTRLLEWWADNEDDAVAADRAKSHRLLIKLRKVRGSIDSTRIYVDPLRMIEWMHEELEDDLRSLLPLAGEILADPSRGFNLNDPVGSAVQPRLRLLKTLDQAYQEFCMNKVHGVASYIGRRVRHGALHGHLVVELRPTLTRITTDFKVTAPEFAEFLRRWARRFDDAVKDFVKARVHVRSTSKPRGVIVASLNDPDKAGIIQTAVEEVANSLRGTTQTTQTIVMMLDYCWHFFEVDLKRARAALEELRREFVIGVSEHVTKRADVDSRITDSIRELNAAMVSRFDVAKSWLTRPTNFSPSASLALMIEAVLDEVRQRFPCNPDVKLGTAGEIDLIGGRFHFIYDALYILIVNGAKYGRTDSGLTVSAESAVSDDERFIFLSVTVGSAIDPTERERRVAEIEEAMSAEVDETLDRMERDEQSGLPKLKGLAETADEIVGFSHRYEGDAVKFTVQLRYHRS